MDDLELALPTGALIAGDAAAVFADARPLVDGLPTGTFPARATGGGLEVRLGAGEPIAWSEPARLAVPSGYAALLDAAALAAYTELGDEPVDEFELLAERFGAADVACFQDVLAVRCSGGTGTAAGAGTAAGTGAAAGAGRTGGTALLRLGRDADGAVCRIVLGFEDGTQ